MKIKIAIDTFLQEQKARGNTVKTYKNYKQNLSYFADFLGDEDVKNITKSTLVDYVVYLQNKVKNESHHYKKINDKERMSSVTVQSYCRHLKTFIGWLYENEYIDINLYAKFRTPKAQKSIINILTEQEIKKIFRACKESPECLRNKLIISLMLYSGLRANEVVTLQKENVFLKKGLVKVFGKGQKERIVPIGDTTMKLIEEYLQIYKPKKEFIVNLQREPVTYESINAFIRRLAKRTKIPRLHAHLLRHTFATNYLIKSSGDISSLKTILGHTSLKMVENYLHLATSYSLGQYRKFCN